MTHAIVSKDVEFYPKRILPKGTRVRVIHRGWMFTLVQWRGETYPLIANQFAKVRGKG